MQSLEIVLFGVVSALALALIGTLVRPYVQRRRRGEVSVGAAHVPAEPVPAPMRLTPSAPLVIRRVCPTCHREFSAGERFCPFDARDLVTTHDSGSRLAPGLTCTRCGRSYDGSRRFCAFDGEELGAAIAPKVPLPAMAHASGAGKICPSCAQRYEPDATFCARDGAELVSVN
jgi:predicted amidophosphoribosyltransferase